ncbi:hypothetical protein [Natronobiforma cellulositropha]
MAAVFVATVLAGSIGFAHYVLVYVLGVNPFESKTLERPSSERGAK